MPKVPLVQTQVAWTTRSTSDSVAHLLDAEDHAHLARLRHRPSRDGSATGRALLRLLVAGHLGTAPSDVVITRRCPDCPRPHGQPRTSGLYLSTAHSEQLVVVALSPSPVGVDVEYRDNAAFPGFDAVALTRAEAANGDDRAQLWARKEALLKQSGIGLRRDPSSIEAPVRGVYDLDLDPGYAAAVATEHPIELIDARGLLPATVASPRTTTA